MRKVLEVFLYILLFLIMKKRFLYPASAIVLVLLVFASCASSPANECKETLVTLSGNAYITAWPQVNAENEKPSGEQANAAAYIDEQRCEICNWNDTATVVSFYFRVAGSGKLNVALQAKGHSLVEVSALGKNKQITLDSDTLSRVAVGQFDVEKPGYVKMDIRGVKISSGNSFGNVAALLVCSNAQEQVACVAPEFSTHFGRRGPSVHLGYALPTENVEWFYNEIVVPEEGDIPSSYYMACGFGEGYFGMQNNSPYPRRVLFSVWSPYNTDNAAEIPDSLRVTLVKKGADVKVQDFGNEGAGGQSYMHYEWKAGERCRFLMGVHPDNNNGTVYTAYFFDNAMGKWRLVASFRRPETSTWYTHAHSFLENFNPVMGYINRKANYQNQWARTVDGKWVPVTRARFTCDATGHQEQRLDYSGGVSGDGFFLTMGGFFDEYMATGTFFERNGNVTEAPDIDFSTLE